MPLSEAQDIYQHVFHRDLCGLLARVVRLLLFCLSAAQNLGTPGNLCHVNADCLHCGVRTALLYGMHTALRYGVHTAAISGFRFYFGPRYRFYVTVEDQALSIILNIAKVLSIRLEFTDAESDTHD